MKSKYKFFFGKMSNEPHLPADFLYVINSQIVVKQCLEGLLFWEGAFQSSWQK